MIDVLRSEWIKVRSIRAHWVLVIFAVAIPVVTAVLVGIFIPEPETGSATDIISLISGVAVVSVLLLASLWVINLTSEYSHNTIRVTYAAVPARWRVVLAKALVGSVVTIIVMAITFVLSYFAGTSILSARGADMSLPEGHDLVGVLVTLIALGVIVSWFGLGLGAIIRNSPATVVVVLLWPLLLENLVTLALTLSGVESAGKWMPYQQAIAAVTDGDRGGNSLGRPGAHLYFGAIALGLLVVGTLLDRRRDA